MPTLAILVIASIFLGGIACLFLFMGCAIRAGEHWYPQPGDRALGLFCFACAIVVLAMIGRTWCILGPLAT